MTLVLAALIACQSSTGFSSNPNENEGVEGTPILTLSAQELLILDAEVGFSRSGELTGTNTGDGNLKIYEVSVLDDAAQVMYFEEPDQTLTLAPTQSLTWRVVATLETAEPASATLRIRTSDPAANDLRIPIDVYPVGQAPPDDTGGSDTGGTE
jgi:hypothetical protein